MNEKPLLPEVATFSPPPAGTWAMLAGAALAGLAGGYFLFTNRWHEMGPTEKQVFLSLTVALLLASAFFFRKGWRRKRSALKTDAEGIWPAHLERNGALVPWRKIAATRSLFWRRRLELLDGSGQVLLGLDSALLGHLARESGAENLGGVLARRLAPPVVAGRLPATFFLPKHYYFVWCAVIAAAAAVVAFQPNLKGIGLAAVFALAIFYQISTTVTRLEVEPGRLVLKSLLAQMPVDRDQILSIAITEDWTFRSARPQAFLILKNRNAFMLHFAGIDALSLKRFLDAGLQLGREGEAEAPPFPETSRPE